MINRFSFASLLLASLFVTFAVTSTDAVAQKRHKSKANMKVATVTQTAPAESPKVRTSIDVMGLQSIGAPQSALMIGDTVVSRDGKVKVVNTPTGSYFIVNQPTAAQRDTLNDWLRSGQRSERASDQKRR